MKQHHRKGDHSLVWACPLAAVEDKKGKQLVRNCGGSTENASPTFLDTRQHYEYLAQSAGLRECQPSTPTHACYRFGLSLLCPRPRTTSYLFFSDGLSVVVGAGFVLVRQTSRANVHKVRTAKHRIVIVFLLAIWPHYVSRFERPAPKLRSLLAFGWEVVCPRHRRRQ